MSSLKRRFFGVMRGRLETWLEEQEPTLRELRYMRFLVGRSPLLILGIIITGSVILLAIFGPYLAPYNPYNQYPIKNCNPSYGDYACPPSTQHLLGTDQSGFDIYSRLLVATRLDLGIALGVVLLTGILGLILGAIAGYRGGKIDELITRITDFFLAFPGLFLVIALVAVLGHSYTTIFVALLIVWWPGYVRLIRSQVLSLRESLFVEAARAVGAGTRRILFKHIIPHVLPQMFIYGSLDVGGVILTLAGLGFLGLGGDTRIPEWGNMIALASGGILFSGPWAVFAPGLAILFTSLGFNLIGDGMRDILDPRLRR